MGILCLLSLFCRYGWTHGITPRKQDVVQTSQGITVQQRQLRLSCTFRWIQNPRRCECQFEALCDMQMSKALSTRDPSAIEREHVHEVRKGLAVLIINLLPRKRPAYHWTLIISFPLWEQRFQYDILPT